MYATPRLGRCLGYNVSRDGHRGFPPTHWPLGGPQAQATPHPIPIIYFKGLNGVRFLDRIWPNRCRKSGFLDSTSGFLDVRGLGS